ncbi:MULTISPECIES: GNAT family N-acetyltransferase [unclassified Streptomyces]|uniref:GNAT family N-acetyltransferase n=1 Tax=unclassified Streptomyces TaxID=2593676 RepID=UPI002E76616B|nr:GNAT family N-acetyltransferase [Streptomyces sp. JV176]MEE1803408.1 GNAT family N-acetyltransferase [Streptomyces sp. JV176]
MPHRPTFARRPLIRPATLIDLPVLQDIEAAAGEAFRALGMAAVADDAPPSLAELERYRSAGRAWVAETVPGGPPVAYLLHDPVDGAAHVEQVSVHPDAARMGVGRALIDHLAGRAAGEGFTALTLTTFADVPWNAPYYARLGFRTLTEDQLTDGLREIRRAEAAHGLDRWPRVCMRRSLTPRSAPAVRSS